MFQQQVVKQQVIISNTFRWFMVVTVYCISLLTPKPYTQHIQLIQLVQQLYYNITRIKHIQYLLQQGKYKITVYIHFYNIYFIKLVFL